MTATQTAPAPAKIQNGFAQRDQLILENLDLVKAIACQVRRTLTVHVEMDDLVHSGTMGLFEAATKYQDDKEVPFTLYAKHRIRGAILDGLRQVDWASREARRQYKQMDTVTRELTAKLQRTPTQVEVAQAMGLDARQWQTLMVEFRSFGRAAAQQRSTDREDRPARELPCDTNDCPDRVLEKTELKEKIFSAVKSLPERYQQVVSLYYENEMTMKEIGALLGVNESRVSQMHKTALAKMQTMLTSKGFSMSAAAC